MKTTFVFGLIVSAFSGVASASDAQIPAFGVICTAQNGASIMLVPRSRAGEVEATLTNKNGIEVASNIHTIVRKEKNDRTVFEIQSWLEMDQKAQFVMFSDENLAQSFFAFNFDSTNDIGMPKFYPYCDVM